MNSLIEALNAVLPQVLWRHRWREYQEKFGVPFARGTMQNRDSEGTGPPFGKVGKRVYYRKEDYLRWLATHVKDGGSDER